jgi:hypothetical protein
MYMNISYINMCKLNTVRYYLTISNYILQFSVRGMASSNQNTLLQWPLLNVVV